MDEPVTSADEDRLRRLRAGAPWGALAGDAGRRAVLSRRWIKLESLERGTPAAQAEVADLQDGARSEARATEDYGGRWAMELLQNAHDAAASVHGGGRAWLTVTDSAVIVANDGFPIGNPELDAITRLGASSKAGSREAVGYKGIGFSAVFEVSSAPQIISDGLGFWFSSLTAASVVTAELGIPLDEVAARRFPLPLSWGQLDGDGDVVRGLLAAGASTVLRLPLRSDAAPANAEQALRDCVAPTTLLFLDGLSGVHLLGRDFSVTRTGAWDAQRVTITGGDRGDASWSIARKRGGLEHSLVERLGLARWDGASTVTAGVAIPDAVEGEWPLHSYFPTDVGSGRRIVLHGDFVLSSNRRQLSESPAGREVNEVVAQVLASAVSEFVAHSHRSDLTQLVGLRQAPQGESPVKVVTAAIDDALRQLAFVACMDGQLRRPDQVRIVRPGLLDGLDVGLFDDAFAGDDIALPSQSRDVESWLKSLGAAVVPTSLLARSIDLTKTSGDQDRLLVIAHALMDVVDVEVVIDHVRESAVLRGADGQRHAGQVLVRGPARHEGGVEVEEPADASLAAVFDRLGIAASSGRITTSHARGHEAGWEQLLAAFVDDPDDTLREIRELVDPVHVLVADGTWQPATAVVVRGSIADELGLPGHRLASSAVDERLADALGLRIGPTITQVELGGSEAVDAAHEGVAASAHSRAGRNQDLDALTFTWWEVDSLDQVLGAPAGLLPTIATWIAKVALPRLGQQARLVDAFGKDQPVNGDNPQLAQIRGSRWLPAVFMGKDARVRPEDGWLDDHKRPATSLLPVLSIDAETAISLGANRVSKPSGAALIVAIRRVAEARVTPDVAVRDLVALLSASDADIPSDLPMPVLRGSEPEWGSQPLVRRLLDGLGHDGAVLDPELPHDVAERLATVLGLVDERAAVAHKVEFEGARRPVPALWSHRRRAELFAALRQRATDPQLQERVASLQVEQHDLLRVRTDRWVTDVRAFVQQSGTTATLHVRAGSVRSPATPVALADALGLGADDMGIVKIWLLAADEAAEHLKLGPGEVEQALDDLGLTEAAPSVQLTAGPDRRGQVSSKTVAGELVFKDGGNPPQGGGFENWPEDAVEDGRAHALTAEPVLVEHTPTSVATDSRPRAALGRRPDAALNRRTEQHAVGIIERLLTLEEDVVKVWRVEDQPVGHDLRCRRGDGSEFAIEVKGVGSLPIDVTLTRNEVHVLGHPESRLYIVVEPDSPMPAVHLFRGGRELVEHFEELTFRYRPA
jgi:hypothetical protein